MESPRPVQRGPRMIAGPGRRRMPLIAGTRPGPYEILALLGSGGMGEVYRTRDARLGREVAVKVLPDTRAADPESLARFEREARAISRLAHPTSPTSRTARPDPALGTSLVSGNGSPASLLPADFNVGDVRFSPDGRAIAFLSDESGQFEAYLTPCRHARASVHDCGRGLMAEFQRDGERRAHCRNPARGEREPGVVAGGRQLAGSRGTLAAPARYVGVAMEAQGAAVRCASAMCQRNCSGVAPGTSFTRRSVYVPVKRCAAPAVVVAVTTTGTVA